MEEESNYLPIKTVKGFQFPKPTMKTPPPIEDDDENNEESDMQLEDVDMDKNEDNEAVHEQPEVTTAMLLAKRKTKMNEYKVRIGVLSSSFLEDPEHRVRLFSKNK